VSAAESTVGGLIEALGGSTPTPASGTGAAVAGAIGAALAELAARVSGDEDGAERAHALGSRLLQLADDDAAAYRAFVETRSEEARSRTIDVPLAIAETAAEVRSLARGVAEHAKASVVGDAEAAAELAAAAARVGVRLVEINIQEDGDDRLVRASALID
jgi:formiminotetrahydrofolate cyclodeaminase